MTAAATSQAIVLPQPAPTPTGPPGPARTSDPTVTRIASPLSVDDSRRSRPPPAATAEYPRNAGAHPPGYTPHWGHRYDRSASPPCGCSRNVCPSATHPNGVHGRPDVRRSSQLGSPTEGGQPFMLLWLLTMLWMTGAPGRDRTPTGPTDVDRAF